MNVLDILKERGFIDNQTHAAELESYLNKRGGKLLYRFRPDCGQPPCRSSDSNHVPFPICSKTAHRPIALVGGGNRHDRRPQRQD